MLELVVRITCQLYADTERLALVGSVPSLGSWKPGNGCRVYTTTNNSNEHEAVLMMPEDEAEYKVVVYDVNKPGKVQWESGSNRFFKKTVFASGSHITTNSADGNALPVEVVSVSRTNFGDWCDCQPGALDLASVADPRKVSDDMHVSMSFMSAVTTVTNVSNVTEEENATSPKQEIPEPASSIKENFSGEDLKTEDVPSSLTESTPLLSEHADKVTPGMTAAEAQEKGIVPPKGHPSVSLHSDVSKCPFFHFQQAREEKEKTAAVTPSASKKEESKDSGAGGILTVIALTALSAIGFVVLSSITGGKFSPAPVEKA
eukprot:CAMPEP_0184691336 /NCGR_PEP_ID=MMETSP0313-20130426/223_1 /TAXON_ID=2792 /ORGANISM="Porphyridium aerugineum, Strain SAG 1380-2" /LENGTH=316 /DNA_ID=CAMNT_0027149033 /DNA_START=163 /DNA_END=1109 /DNA_ORIENTATION=+